MKVLSRAGLPQGRWKGRAVLSFRRTAWFEGEDASLVGLLAPGLSPSPAGFELEGPLPAVRLGLRLESDGERWWLEGRGELAGASRSPDVTSWLPGSGQAVPEDGWAARWDSWLGSTLPTAEGQWLVARLRGPREPWPSLIGWGSGSTPLGDDYLAGWLAARWSRGIDPAIDRARLKQALPRTSKLSRHYLAHLAAGRVEASLAAFLTSVPLPEPGSGPALALAEHGDLSGRATLVGLVAGLRGDL